MIKKIISYFLMLTIIMSGLGVFAADTVSKTDSIAQRVVVGLGIMDAGKDMNEEVSRAEFATIAIRLYGEEAVSELESGTKTPYLDVSAEHFKSSDIAKAYELGIIRGYDDGNYYPEKSLQLSEAVKIVLDMLGYGDYVLYRGGYAQGYVAEGAKIGLTSGIKKAYNEAITYAELARIIYNARDIEIIEIASMESDNVIFNKEENETFLSKYHDIYAGEGVVSSTGVTKINGSSVIGKNQIAIDEEIYVTKTSDFDKLLGLNCEFYYEEDGSGSKILRYAIEVDNEMVEFFGRDITSAKDGVIEVSDADGEIEEYDLADNGNVIYNGIYYGKVVNYEELGKLEELAGLTGKIRLIDSNSDGDYDAVFVTEYQNFVVERALHKDDKLVLKNLDGDASNDIIEFTGNTFGSITKNGAEMELIDFVGGELVSVALSDGFFGATGRRVADIIVSSNAITANVTQMADDEVSLSWQEGKKEYNETYRVSDNFIGQNGAIIEIRTSGTFHIDAMGEIGYLQLSADSGMQFGYIIGTHQERGFNGDYKLKIFTSSSDIVYYYAADNVNVDGVKVKKSEVEDILLRSTNSEDYTVKQMVRYDTNASGLLSELDTLLPNVDGDPDELTAIEMPAGGVSYWNSQRMISGGGNRYFINTSKVFRIPIGSNPTDEEYKMGSASSFKDNTTYGKQPAEKMIMYNVVDAVPAVVEHRSAVATVAMSGISTVEDEISVVIKRYDTINARGEECTALKIRQKTSNITLYLNPDTTMAFCHIPGSTSTTQYKNIETEEALTFEDFNFGDIVFYSLDNKGDVASILKTNEFNLFDCVKGGDTDDDPETHPYVQQQSGGYYERISGSVRKINGKQILVDIGTRDLWINPVHGTVQVYLVDSDKKTVSSISFADIIASEDDSIADKIFVRTRHYWIKQLVIYR